MCSPCQHLASGLIPLYDRGQRQGTELEQVIRQARLVRPRGRWRLRARKVLDATTRLCHLGKLP